MTDKILNWGLLSTARINKALIPPIRSSKRNQLLAVASRSQESAEQYARKWKIPRAHGSYQALLADPEIDVVYNPLPNHLHAEWTIKAVQAGKHVLCEKPLALNLEEVDAISAAAKEHGRVVTEAFMYRHHPQTIKVQDMAQKDHLGSIKLIRGSFSFELKREADIRLDPTMGGGSLWDIGCYPLSFIRTTLASEPLEVFAWQVPGSTGVDMTFVAQLRFACDVFAQFDCSFNLPRHTYIEIIGSRGTLIIPEPFLPGLNEKMFLVQEGKTETLKIKGQDLYLGEVEDLTDAILGGELPRISLADSRANVSAILALLESARKNAPLKL